MELRFLALRVLMGLKWEMTIGAAGSAELVRRAETRKWMRILRRLHYSLWFMALILVLVAALMP